MPPQAQTATAGPSSTNSPAAILSARSWTEPCDSPRVCIWCVGRAPQHPREESAWLRQCNWQRGMPAAPYDTVARAFVRSTNGLYPARSVICSCLVVDSFVKLCQSTTSFALAAAAYLSLLPPPFRLLASLATDPQPASTFLKDAGSRLERLRRRAEGRQRPSCAVREALGTHPRGAREAAPDEADVLDIDQHLCDHRHCKHQHILLLEGRVPDVCLRSS